MLSKALACFLLASGTLTPLNEDGYRELVAKYKNKVLLVSFWATWCEPCRVELPRLAALQRQLPARDFSLVTVSIDEPEQGDQARRLLTLRGPAYMATIQNRDAFINAVDPGWSGALPALFLYDRHGALVRAFTRDPDLNEVSRAVRKLIRNAVSP